MSKKTLLSLASIGSILALTTISTNTNISNSQIPKNIDKLTFSNGENFSQEQILNLIKERIKNNNEDKTNIYQLDWFLNPNGNFNYFRTIDGHKDKKIPKSKIRWNSRLITRGGTNENKNMSFLDSKIDNFNQSKNYLSETINILSNNENEIKTKSNTYQKEIDDFNSKTEFPLENNEANVLFINKEKFEIDKILGWSWKIKEGDQSSETNKELKNLIQDQNHNVELSSKIFNLHSKSTFLNTSWFEEDGEIKTHDRKRYFVPFINRDLNFSRFFKDSNESKEYFKHLVYLGLKPEILNKIYSPHYDSRSYQGPDLGKYYVSPNWYASNGGKEFLEQKSDESIFLTNILILNKYILDNNIKSGYIKDIYNSNQFKQFLENKKFDYSFDKFGGYLPNKKIDITYIDWKQEFDNLFVNLNKDISEMKKYSTVERHLENFASSNYHSQSYDFSKEIKKEDRTINKKHEIKYSLLLSNENKRNYDNSLIQFAFDKAKITTKRDFNFNSLFTINFDKTSKNLNKGNIYKEIIPELHLGLNLKLINSLYTKSYLVDFYRKFKNFSLSKKEFNNRNFHNIFTKGYQEYVQFFNNFLLKSLNGIFTLEQLKDIEKLFKLIYDKDSIINPKLIQDIKNNSKIENHIFELEENFYSKKDAANWSQILNERNINLTKFEIKNPESLLKIDLLDEIISNENNSSDSTNQKMELNDWNYEYHFMLPIILNKDIYAKIKYNHEKEYSIVKIYDKETKKFIPINLKPRNNLQDGYQNPQSSISILSLLIENNDQFLGHSFKNNTLLKEDEKSYIEIKSKEIFSNAKKDSVKSKNNVIINIKKEDFGEEILKYFSLNFNKEKLIYSAQYSPQAPEISIDYSKFISIGKSSPITSGILLEESDENYIASYYENDINIETRNNIVKNSILNIFDFTKSKEFENDKTKQEKIVFSLKNEENDFKIITIEDIEKLFNIQETGQILSLNNAKNVDQKYRKIQSAIIDKNISAGELLANDYDGYFWVKTSFSPFINVSELEYKKGFIFIGPEVNENNELISNDFLIRINMSKTKIRIKENIKNIINKLIDTNKNNSYKNYKEIEYYINSFDNQTTKNFLNNLMSFSSKELNVELESISLIDDFDVEKENINKFMVFATNDYIKEITKKILELQDKQSLLKNETNEISFLEIKNLIYHFTLNFYQGFYAPYQFGNILELLNKILNSQIQLKEIISLMDKIKNYPNENIVYANLIIPKLKPDNFSLWWSNFIEKYPLEKIEENLKKTNKDFYQYYLENKDKNEIKELSEKENQKEIFLELNYQDSFTLTNNKEIEIDIFDALINHMNIPKNWIFIEEENKILIPIENILNKTILLNKPEIIIHKYKKYINNSLESSIEKLKELSLEEKKSLFNFQATKKWQLIDEAIANIDFSLNGNNKIKIYFDLNPKFSFNSNFSGALAIEYENKKDNKGNNVINLQENFKIIEEKDDRKRTNNIFNNWIFWLIATISTIGIISLVVMIILIIKKRRKII